MPVLKLELPQLKPKLELKPLKYQKLSERMVVEKSEN